MKKIITILTTLLMMLLFSAQVIAAEMTPIKLIEITGLAYPYSTGSVLDTTVDVEDGSSSYFMELEWKITADGLNRVYIKTRTYYDYIYDENTRATINGNEADIIEIDESKRIIIFAYTFPNDESVSKPNSSSSLLHTITVMYTKNGKITPNPIKAPHRKNITVQIVPDEGYRVKDVVVDGESVGAVTEYTFKRVTETHKIKAYFEPIPGYVPSDKEEVVSGDASGNIEETVINFKDVLKAEWYYDAVQFVCNNKLFAGTSETTFEPDAVMTRAMIVKVLYNHADKNNLITSGEVAVNDFEDVVENDWYEEAVEWAVRTGVTNGTSETTFSPEESLTREQLITLLYRYAKSIDLDVSVGEDTNILSYDDSFDISEYAIEAFQWGCGSGVINGKTNSTLAPQDPVTRAEVATMMMRFSNIK